MKLRATLLGAAMLAACGDATGPARPAPVLHDLSPGTIVVGSGPTTVVLWGVDFAAAARVLADGVERATTVHGTTVVSTRFEREELTSPRVITLAVATPGPGGGTSGTLDLFVTLPPPAIASVTPAELPAGGPPVTLRILGQRFHPSAVVRLNGNDRPTRVLSETEVEADLFAVDLLVPMRARLAVANPILEGGSAEVDLPIYNPQPSITALSPARRMIGSSTFALTVSGANFVPGAVVMWHDQPRTTTYVSSSRLLAEIPASDLAVADSVPITVANPDPAPAASAAQTFVVHAPILLDLLAWDLVWDHVRGRLYASVASVDPRYPDEVVAIDPETGDIVARVSPGAGPRQLAIADDASKLYVTLDGEAAVARIDAATFARDLWFLVGSGSQGQQWAQDIEVMPGAPGTVAISRVLPATNRHDGVAIYDDGVMRPVTTPGGNVIEFASPTTLYGYHNESTAFYLYRLDVSASGVAVRSVTEGLVEEFSNDIRYGGGYLFSIGGEHTPARVVDAATGLLVASLTVNGLPCPEPRGGRVYYLTHTTLYAVSTLSWVVVGAEPVPPGAPPSWFGVTRWGDDGLAYIGPSQVAIYRSDLVGSP